MLKTLASPPRAPPMEQSPSDSSSRQLNYTEKYLPDKPGEELGPDARAWKVYLDEQEEHDKDMVTGFRDNIDALLVFAALFSSVVTGFAVPAAERLEPDHAEINTSILFEVSQLLRANGNATLIAATPPSELHPGSVTHTLTDVWVAWLFFASLALSLVTTLFSVLAKQWLQEFYAFVPGDTKWRSLTRQFRSNGMRRWWFRDIVGSLPLLLHMALALFFAGLCGYIQRYDFSLLVMLGLISVVAFTLYMIAASLPAVFIDCPYRIPALFVVASKILSFFKANRWFFATQLWPSIRNLLQQLCCSSSSHDDGEKVEMDDVAQLSSSRNAVQTSEPDDDTLALDAPGSSMKLYPSSLISTKESKEIQRNIALLEFLSLERLYNERAHASVRRAISPGLTRIILKYGNTALNSETKPPPFPPETLHPLASPLLQYIVYPVLSTLNYNINALHSTEAMTSHESLPLETLHLSAVAVLNGLSGSKTIEALPELLEFYMHSCPLLGYSPMLPESRWPSLIESPHLEAFLSHDLLPLDVRFFVSPGVLESCDGSPFQIACYVGRWDIVQWLLRHRSTQLSLTEVDSRGWLPLGRAAASSKISTEDWEEIVAVMQQNKVDVMSNEVNSMRETALHLLCENGVELAKIKAIVPQNYEREKDDWNLKQQDGQTPLHRLCMRRSEEHQRLAIANYLLSKGADVGAIDDLGRTPLHFAALHSPPKIVDALCSCLSTVKNPLDVINHCAADGRTALHFACSNAQRSYETVKLLLSHGADPNIVDKRGNLPLHFACVWRPDDLGLKADIIEILLDKAVKINVRSDKEQTPLDKLQERNSVSQEFQKARSLMIDHKAKSASELGELVTPKNPEKPEEPGLSLTLEHVEQ